MDVNDARETGLAIAREGPFDILFKNAGAALPKPMLDTSPDDFDGIMGVNVRGAYFVTQAAARGMIAPGSGGCAAWIKSRVKLDRIARLEDLMGAILFLAGGDAAVVTGTSLLVDGGWTAG